MTEAAPETVAWFHCFAGIAGDMALGSLLDAGADLTEIRTLLGRLELPGWDLHVEEGLRGGIACTRVVVEGDDAVVRTHAAIAGLIEGAALPPRVAERSLGVFHALATVEAALHRQPVDQVHFHEVGGHDAIVDIVGTASTLEVLGVDVVGASAVATGTGLVRSARTAGSPIRLRPRCACSKACRPTGVTWRSSSRHRPVPRSSPPCALRSARSRT